MRCLRDSPGREWEAADHQFCGGGGLAGLEAVKAVGGPMVYAVPSPASWSADGSASRSLRRGELGDTRVRVQLPPFAFSRNTPLQHCHSLLPCAPLPASPPHPARPLLCPIFRSY